MPTRTADRHRLARTLLQNIDNALAENAGRWSPIKLPTTRWELVQAMQNEGWRRSTLAEWFSSTHPQPQRIPAIAIPAITRALGTVTPERLLWGA